MCFVLVIALMDPVDLLVPQINDSIHPASRIARKVAPDAHIGDVWSLIVLIFRQIIENVAHGSSKAKGGGLIVLRPQALDH